MVFNGNSPWLVNNLEEFLYYCCPECDERNQLKDNFIQHAFEHHPESKEAIESISCFVDIKEEKLEIKLEDHQNDVNDFIPKFESNEDNIIEGNIVAENLKQSEDSVETKTIYKFNRASDEEHDDSDYEPLAKKKKIKIIYRFNKQSDEELDDSDYEPLAKKKSKRNHKCDQCDRWFNRSNDLTRHMDRVHFDPLAEKKKPDGPNAHKCEICSQSFKRFQSLKRHTQTVHEGLKDYKCEVCEKAFTSNSTLKNHIETFHYVQNGDGVYKKYQCKSCEKSFKNIAMLKDHAKSVHEGINAWKCDLCDETFGFRVVLRTHMRDFHGDSLKLNCKYCETSFSNRSSLNEHIRESHKDTLQCQLCNKIFSVRKKLVLHLRIDHPKKKCELCGSNYQHLIDLQKHKKAIHGIDYELPGPKFICEECGKVCLNTSQLLSHKDKVHNVSSEPDSICNQCGKSFKRKRLLEQHIKRDISDIIECIYV